MAKLKVEDRTTAQFDISPGTRDVAEAWACLPW